MILTKKILVISLIALSLRSFCQSREKQIGLGSGISYHAVKNNSISSFTHTGLGLPIMLFFRFNTEKNRHHAQIFYTAPSLKSTSKLPVSAKMQTGYFQYAYHRRFASAKEKIVFFGGAVLNFNGAYLLTSWNDNNSSMNATGEGFISISPSILAEVSLRKNSISIQAWSSVLAYTITGGYANLVYETDWLSLSDFLSVDLRMAYSRNLSEKFGLRLEYKFEYYHLQKYQSVVQLSHQTLFSIFYRIY